VPLQLNVRNLYISRSLAKQVTKHLQLSWQFAPMMNRGFCGEKMFYESAPMTKFH
jgi:hypothetical protein